MLRAESIFKGSFDPGSPLSSSTIASSTSATEEEDDPQQPLQALTTQQSRTSIGTLSNMKQSSSANDITTPATSVHSTNSSTNSNSNSEDPLEVSNVADSNSLTATTSVQEGQEPPPLQYKENKEPRFYPKDQEDQAYQEILSALDPHEQHLLHDHNDGNLIMRHYRADKGNIPKAIQRTKYAIQWRHRFQVDDIIASVHTQDMSLLTDNQRTLRQTIHKEGESGKVYVRGYDKDGRAILYLYQARENTNDAVNNIKHLVYQIERSIAATQKHGFEKIVIIMDFTNWSIREAPPMNVTKETIHILQECYVERMKRVYMMNTPVIFRSFWAMVKPFLDPVTKEKVVFCGTGKKARSLMEEHFDLNVLEKEAFGTNKDLKPYDSKEYFSAPFDTVFDE